MEEGQDDFGGLGEAFGGFLNAFGELGKILKYVCPVCHVLFT